MIMLIRIIWPSESKPVPATVTFGSDLFDRLFVCLSVCLSLCRSVALSVHLPVCLPVCLSVCLSSVCLPVLSACVFARLMLAHLFNRKTQRKAGNQHNVGQLSCLMNRTICLTVDPCR